MENLPAELKLHVAEQLDPESCLDLALTCKEYHRLFRSVLKYHTEQFSKWRILDLGKMPIYGGADMPKSIGSILKAILMNPRDGWYIQELNIPQHRDHDPSAVAAFDGKDLIGPVDDEDQDRFDEAFRMLQALYPPDGKDLSTSWRFSEGLEPHYVNGDDDTIIVILIHFLPNLQTLRVTNSEVDMLRGLIDKVAQGYQDPLKASNMPLQRLKTAFVSHDDSEGACDSGWARSFARIPSLRTFAADKIGDEPWGNASMSKEPVIFSNITEIFLQRCRPGENILNAILAGAKRLRKFTYNIADIDVAYDVPYNPKKLLRDIMLHTKDSLEELILSLDDGADDSETEETTQTVSLREFKKLRLLDCRWSMLRPEIDASHDDALEDGFYKAEDTDFDVMEILPKSLETLYLHGEFENVEWDGLKRILEKKSSTLPNLTKVYFTKLQDTWTFQVEDVFGNTDPPPKDIYGTLYALFDGHGYS